MACININVEGGSILTFTSISFKLHNSGNPPLVTLHVWANVIFAMPTYSLSVTLHVFNWESSHL